MADEQEKTTQARSQSESGGSQSRGASRRRSGGDEEGRPTAGGTLPGPSGTPERRAGVVGKGRLAAVSTPDESQMERTERDDDAPEGAPLWTTRPKYGEAGPETSNADIDLSAASAIAEHSEYVENPNPNPDDIRPAPGPSTVQVLGTADSIDDSDGEPLANKMEETRNR